jgi:hypothetical protein
MSVGDILKGHEAFKIEEGVRFQNILGLSRGSCGRTSETVFNTVSSMK